MRRGVHVLEELVLRGGDHKRNRRHGRGAHVVSKCSRPPRPAPPIHPPHAQLLSPKKGMSRTQSAERRRERSETLSRRRERRGVQIGVNSPCSFFISFRLRRSWAAPKNSTRITLLIHVTWLEAHELAFLLVLLCARAHSCSSFSSPMASFNMLASEIVSLIFALLWSSLDPEHLPDRYAAISLVCRSWHHILTHTPEVHSIVVPWAQLYTRRILSNGTWTVETSPSQCGHLVNSLAMEEITPYLPRFQRRFSMYLAPDACWVLLRHFHELSVPSLQELELVVTSKLFVNIPARSLDGLYPQMSRLVLTGPFGIHWGDDPSSTAQCFPNLVHLSLQRLTTLQTRKYPTLLHFITFLHLCPSLRRLELDEFVFRDETRTIPKGMTCSLQSIHLTGSWNTNP